MIGRTNTSGTINEPSYEQIINYTMLYDGSLGDATENQCVDITGGYSKQINSDYAEDTVIFNDNNIYCKADRPSGTTKNYLSRFSSNSLINLENYNKIGVLAKATLESYNYAHCSIEISTAKIGGTRIIQIANNTIVQNNSLNGTKYIYCGNVSELETKDGYFCAQVLSMNGAGASNLAELNIYSAFLTKPDDWQTLASKANMTVNSINDILTNSNTLLSHKEAVEYMIYNCTGDFMASAIQSETFLTALNNSDYKTKIQANKHWNKFLNMVA